MEYGSKVIHRELTCVVPALHHLLVLLVDLGPQLLDGTEIPGDSRRSRTGNVSTSPCVTVPTCVWKQRARVKARLLPCNGSELALMHLGTASTTSTTRTCRRDQPSETTRDGGRQWPAVCTWNSIMMSLSFFFCVLNIAAHVPA